MATLDASQSANRSAMDPEAAGGHLHSLASAIVAGAVPEHVLAPLWVARRSGRTRPLIEGVDWRWTYARWRDRPDRGPGVVGAWFQPKIRHLALETAIELMKVTWPTWAETQVSTIAVVVASLVAAVILFFIDTSQLQADGGVAARAVGEAVMAEKRWYVGPHLLGLREQGEEEPGGEDPAGGPAGLSSARS